MNQILRKYRAAGTEEITLRLDEHHARCVAARKAADKAKKCAEEADAAYEKLMELEKQATEDLDLVTGDSREATLGRSLAEERKRSAALSSRLASEKGKLAVIGDPLVMRSESDLTSSLPSLPTRRKSADSTMPLRCPHAPNRWPSTMQSA